MAISMDPKRLCTLVVVILLLLLSSSSPAPSLSNLLQPPPDLHNCVLVIDSTLPLTSCSRNLNFHFDEVEQVVSEVLAPQQFPNDQDHVPAIIFNHREPKGNNSVQRRLLESKWTWSTDCIYVFLISDTMKFVHESIQAYGAALSQNSILFVPQKWTTPNLPSLTYDFGPIVNLPLAFIKYNSDSDSDSKSRPNHWNLYCYLCNDHFQPSPLVPSLYHNFQSRLQCLQALHHQYNFYGYGTVGLLNRIGFRSTIASADYHRSIETNAWFKYDPNISKNGAILGILINMFNFTVELEMWSVNGTLQEEGNYSGIYLAPGGDLPPKYRHGMYIVLTHKLTEFFLYCRSKPIVKATGWDFFSQPFDTWIWASIAIIAIIYSLLHRCQLRYGLDMFWAVLGLPFERLASWRNSKLLSSLLVTMIVLNCGYLSVITSRVIIPNTEPDIETPTELFNQGFRFVDKNGSSTSYSNYYELSLRKWGIDPKHVVHELPKGFICAHTHDPPCISSLPDKATGLVYTHLKTVTLLSIQPEERRVNCHGVKAPFREYWVTFYEQSSLAEVMYYIHLKLLAGGIDVCWEKLETAGRLLAAWRKTTWNTSLDPPKLNFDTPILVVFKAYIVFILICCTVFTLETVGYYISRYLVRLKNRIRVIQQLSLELR